MIALAVAGCVQSDISAKRPLPEADEHFYRCEVQPVLAARCAFMDCHGTPERALSIYAEQRYRLGIDWREYETPITADELAANFRAVRGFFARDGSETDQLSEKPLDTRAGGLFHRGKDLYGAEDVFVSRDDPGYRILRDFIAGATRAPGCVPTEEVGL
jgi:hypothetical protein